MNFGILMVQDFDNAYSTFIAQNYGAGKKDRIRKGTKESLKYLQHYCSDALSGIGIPEIYYFRCFSSALLLFSASGFLKSTISVAFLPLFYSF